MGHFTADVGFGHLGLIIKGGFIFDFGDHIACTSYILHVVYSYSVFCTIYIHRIFLFAYISNVYSCPSYLTIPNPAYTKLHNLIHLSSKRVGHLHRSNIDIKSFDIKRHFPSCACSLVDVLAADRPVEPISLIPPSDDHLTTSSSPTTFFFVFPTVFFFLPILHRIFAGPV